MGSSHRNGPGGTDDDKAGIGANTVNRIELNETEPHMSTIRKLARALGVEPRRLVKGEDDA